MMRLGESCPRWWGRLKSSSFSIHNSSLLFWREKVLSALELRIVRFGNDVVGKDVSAVVGRIREHISSNFHGCR
jgi:hypothetical protein